MRRRVGQHQVAAGPLHSDAHDFPADVYWTNAIHGETGNILFADGAVEQLSAAGLQRAIGSPTRLYRPPGGEYDADVLEQAMGQDVWVRWRGSFDYSPGTKMTLVARATDGNGAIQEEAFTLPEPNGGTGWPRIDVG